MARKKKRGKRRGKACYTRRKHKVCRSGHRKATRKHRKGGKRRGGKYSAFVKAQWRKHRAKLMSMGAKRAMKHIAALWKRK